MSRSVGRRVAIQTRGQADGGKKRLTFDLKALLTDPETLEVFCAEYLRAGGWEVKPPRKKLEGTTEGVGK